MILNCLAVGAGGAIGSVSRYLLGLLPVKPQNGFPLTTFGINITGAFCIGLTVALAVKNVDFDPRLLLFLRVGVCGGFTTFSAFSIETLGLLQSGQWAVAVLYAALSVILCIAAAAVAPMIVK